MKKSVIIRANLWLNSSEDINMKKARRIVLIGFRGVGKTTIAKRLSETLNWPRISTDELIEARENMKIPEIVEKGGWPKFRQIESEEIRKAAEINHCIIDCGGGVVENPSNMEILSKDSLIVWVDAAIDDIYQWLMQMGDRPLLNQPNIRQDIETNYRRREKLYRQYSTIYVNTSTESFDTICQKIVEIST